MCTARAAGTERLGSARPFLRPARPLAALAAASARRLRRRGPRRHPDRRPLGRLDLRLRHLPPRRAGRRLRGLRAAEGGPEPLGRGRGHRRRPDARRAALPHGRSRPRPRHGRMGGRARAALPPRDRRAPARPGRRLAQRHRAAARGRALRRAARPRRDRPGGGGDARRPRLRPAGLEPRREGAAGHRSPIPAKRGSRRCSRTPRSWSRCCPARRRPRTCSTPSGWRCCRRAPG